MKRLALTLGLAAFVAACGGGGDDSGSGEGVTLPEGTVSAEAVVDIIDSFDPGDEQAIAELNEVIYAGGDEIIPALAAMLKDEDPDKRWAATYVMGPLADTDEEIALLAPMLDDENATLRVVAAGSLAGRGVTEALPVLIEGLASEDDLPFSDPPRPLRAQAQFALEELTGESLESAEEWQSWWEDVQGSIRWEGGAYVTD